MTNQDMPRLTKFLYTVLELIDELGVVDRPRKILPLLVRSRLDLSECAANAKKLNGKLVYADRTGWALTFLKKAKLIQFPKRGNAIITDEGRLLLVACKDEGVIKINKLLAIPEFKEFYMPKRKSSLVEKVARENQDKKISDGNLKHHVEYVGIKVNPNIFPELLKSLLGGGFSFATKNGDLEIIKA